MNIGESAPTNDEMRIAAIEATAIGMQAVGRDNYRKHEQTEARSDRTASYRGEIVGENKHFIVQKLNPLNTVRHAKQDLPTIPKHGSQVRISYSKHSAKITNEMKHDRKRSHTISM